MPEKNRNVRKAQRCLGRNKDEKKKQGSSTECALKGSVKEYGFIAHTVRNCAEITPLDICTPVLKGQKRKLVHIPTKAPTGSGESTYLCR